MSESAAGPANSVNNTSTNRPSGYPLRIVRPGIDTHQQAIAFIARACPVCRSEGFNALSRIVLSNGTHQIMAGLNIIDGDWLEPDCVGVSESAWHLLHVQQDDVVMVSHAPLLESLAHVRAKIYGHKLSRNALADIVNDITASRYSDVQLTAFITACGGDNLGLEETIALTDAMVNAGQRLTWGAAQIMDKHCVGGLPGNRTTPLVVALLAANGLRIPKTSSRAITSPAGTADTMETLTRVELDLPSMRRVVELEGGCMVWGGAVNLSPSDDILIRIERALDIDSEGQMVASVLSKKIAAGASHVLIDIPVGPTAKVRSETAGLQLGMALKNVGEALGLHVRAYLSDGSRPIGYGIGPALEAHDLLAVLQNHPSAPQDLRNRALELTGELLEMGGAAQTGQGRLLAEQTLISGAAWQKFQAICHAQGGLFEPGVAEYKQDVLAPSTGTISAIDSRVLSRVAKLAGAPGAPLAGIHLAVNVGTSVQKNDLLFTLHAQTPGELSYASDYLRQHPELFSFDESLHTGI